MMKFQQSVGFINPLKLFTTHTFLVLLCLLCILLTACNSTTSAGKSTPTRKATIPSTNSLQPVSYSTIPQDVVIRTFYGGGIYGALEMSPDISIYGDGTYILGPGLDIRKGKLDSDTLQSLLNTLVNTNRLLSFHRQQFYDIQDANATLLELMLDGKSYEFLYGQFGNLQESASDLDEYHRLGKALTTINDKLYGPTTPYTSTNGALLVRQNFSPDVSKTIPDWSLKDFTLEQIAMYECGPIPRDETSPNAETGCLKYLIPHKAVLLNPAQLRNITELLHNQQEGVFYERGLYYTVFLRPLLPDEYQLENLAMFGSMQLSFTRVPLDVWTTGTP